MYFIDTHTHLYLNEFANDFEEAVGRAVQNGVRKLLLPDIDSRTRQQMIDRARKFPDICLPMIGLHPTSVKENYREELLLLDKALQEQVFYGIGETGIDLYWDKTFITQQTESFIHHIELSLQYDLPIVIHSRKSLNEIFKILENYKNKGLRGVFHCFPGNIIEAEKVVRLGFYLGIGGVVTYKNSGMAEVVKHFGLEHIVLETDSPFLPPVPYRGKRNESSYLPEIARFVAQLLNKDIEDVSYVTTENAQKLFNISRNA